MARRDYVRNRPRTISIPARDGTSSVSGHDQSDVWRDILLAAMEQQGWNQQTAAERLGVAQSSISRFLAGSAPGKLTLVGPLCTALNRSPLDLLAEHPLYTTGKGITRSPGREDVAVRLDALLGEDEARRLVETLEEARNHGVLSQCLKQLEASLALADEVARVTTRSHPKSGKRASARGPTRTGSFRPKRQQRRKQT
jgi:transcriptional regulator with XRE-family HTH domain